MPILHKRILSVILASAMIMAHLPLSAVHAKEDAQEQSFSETEFLEEESAEYTTEDETVKESSSVQESQSSEDILPEASKIEDKSEEYTETESTSDVDVSEEESSSDGEESEETEEATDIVEESETLSDVEDVGLSDTGMIVETVELDGVYQFGGAPSKYADVSESALLEEIDNGAVSVSIEEYIYNELLKRNPKINVSMYNIPTTIGKMSDIFRGVLNEHPDLYFVIGAGRSWFSFNSSRVESIEPDYAKSGTFNDALFKRRTAEALSGIKPGMTDLQKAIVLHDWIVLNCEYDYDNYQNGTIPAASYTAYGVLANRKAVCQGYALAYKYLLNQIGIECLMVTSRAMNHAWNMIKLDGEYYQVDATWDDPVWDMMGRVGHMYMLKSDTAFQDNTKRRPHYSWDVTRGGYVIDCKATDTKYDSAFWDDVTSPLVLDGDNCYYTDDIGDIEIYKTVLSSVTDEGSPICEIVKWAEWYTRGCWHDTYTGLFKANNRLYYNGKDKIYSIKLDGTDRQDVYSIDPSTEGGYIYGSALLDGSLWYVLCQDRNSDEKATPQDSGIEIGRAESIALNKSALELMPGNSETLAAEVTPSDTIDIVTWTSSNPAVATVSGGKVTALKAGTCVITATVGTKSAACAVTVVIPATGIALNKTALTLSANKSETLTAAVTPRNTTDTVTWTSSDSTIAAVANGKVTAVKAGTCTITATAGTKSAACAVTVIIPATGIRLNKAALTLDANESETLTAAVIPNDTTDIVTWTSSKPSVAAVDNGTVTAVAKGTCTITAKVGTKSATCAVTVKIPAADIKLNKTALTLEANKSETLTAAVAPSNTTDTVTWTSSDSTIAKAASGKVTAVKPGTCTITATAGKKSAACTVTVTIAATGIALNKDALVLEAGKSETLTATVAPRNTTDTAIWASSDLSVAAVDYNGTVTAVKAGTCTITATAGKKSAACAVIAKAVPIPATGIALDNDALELKVGDDAALTATVIPDNATDTVVWTSSNLSVAAVDNGTVTAVAKGTCTITATAGKKSASCAVAVTKSATDGHTVYVVTNVDKKLGDAAVKGQLPEGWAWTDESALISSFAGAAEKELSVAYANAETGKQSYDKVKVCFSTIGGIELKDEDGNAVSKLVYDALYVPPDGSQAPDPNVTDAIISANISGTRAENNNRLKEFTYSVEFAPKAKTDVVGLGVLNKSNGDIKIPLTAKKAGSTTLLIKLKKGDTIYYEKKIAISVANIGVNGLADIKTGLYQGGTEIQTDAGDNGSYKISIGTPLQAAYIQNETDVKFKLAYSSSDASVLKIRNATKAEPTKIPLTPLKAGTAILTVTANDVPKTAKTYLVRVTNAIADTEAKLAGTISLNRTSVTVNTALTASDTVTAVYNGFGGTLESAELAAAPKSKLAGINAEIIKADGTNTNEIRFSVKNGISPVGGSGNLTVTLKTGADEKAVIVTKVLPVTVTVRNTAPSVTIAQLDRLNIFYKDKPGHFSVGSPDGEITDVALEYYVNATKSEPMADEDYSFADGVVTVNRVEEGKKRLNFSVTVAGYSQPVVKKNIALSTETADFKLSAAEGTVYTGTGVMSTTVRLIDKVTGLAVDLSNVNPAIEKYDAASKQYTEDTGYTYDIKGEKLILSTDTMPDSRGGDKLKLKFTSSEWNGYREFTYTLKGADLAKASLALGKTSLTLYNYKGMHASTETTLTLKGGSEAADILKKQNVTITEIVARKVIPSLNNTLKVGFEDGILKVSKNSGDLKAGTYKFTISLTAAGLNKPLTTTLTVRVIDVDMADNSKTKAKATASASGTIDVLNRQGTFLIITPRFTNVPTDAKVAKVELTGADARLFAIVRQTGNQVTVSLQDDVDVVTKYAYKLQAVYTVQAGDTTLTLTSNVLSIKLTQRTPKIKSSGENVFSSTRSDIKQICFALTNSVGASIKAKEIKLVSAPKDFAYDFAKDELCYTPRGATSSNKSYTLKFEVYPAGCGLNEKPLTVSYRVTIAK